MFYIFDRLIKNAKTLLFQNFILWQLSRDKCRCNNTSVNLGTYVGIYDYTSHLVCLLITIKIRRPISNKLNCKLSKSYSKFIIFSISLFLQSKEESFNSETFSTEEVVKKVKKTKSTTTKTTKTKTVKTFDQEEEMMLMESSREVVSAIEPSNNNAIEESVSTQFEENSVLVTSENGDSNTNKPPKKKSEGGSRKKGKKTKKSENGKENHISVVKSEILNGQ